MSNVSLVLFTFSGSSAAKDGMKTASKDDRGECLIAFNVTEDESQCSVVRWIVSWLRDKSFIE